MINFIGKMCQSVWDKQYINMILVLKKFNLKWERDKSLSNTSQQTECAMRTR